MATSTYTFSASDFPPRPRTLTIGRCRRSCSPMRARSMRTGVTWDKGRKGQPCDGAIAARRAESGTTPRAQSIHAFGDRDSSIAGGWGGGTQWEALVQILSRPTLGYGSHTYAE